MPATRGPERSRQLADVVLETEAVVRDGMTEIVLLGQTVNSYNDGSHDFADLLRAVGVVDPARLNVHGGSLAFGHPFAATGARMVTTMARELHDTGKATALLGICAQGGGLGRRRAVRERRRGLASPHSCQRPGGIR